MSEDLLEPYRVGVSGMAACRSADDDYVVAVVKREGVSRHLLGGVEHDLGGRVFFRKNRKNAP